MSIDSNPNDELNDFENLLFGKAEDEAPVEEASETDEAEEETEEEVQEDDTEDDSLATDDEDEDEDEEEEEPAPEPKSKKKTYQDRIDQLTAKAREAERREAIREREIAELRRMLDEAKPEKKEAPALRDTLPEGAPNPDAKKEDGEPLYPLGEFDPRYIAELTRFTIRQENEAAELEKAQKEEAAQLQAAQRELATAWEEKLVAAEDDYPEIREEIAGLAEVFQDIEPSYGEYLAVTIMSSDVGPQLMKYFSDNIREAQNIVASGPAAATLALGRLEAKILNARPSQSEDKGTKKVSKAKEPPQDATRGHGGKFITRPDTDNLDAFEREFFKK